MSERRMERLVNPGELLFNFVVIVSLVSLSSASLDPEFGYKASTARGAQGNSARIFFQSLSSGGTPLGGTPI